MKKLLLLMFVAFSINANAKFTETLNIKYEQKYGWSKYYNVNVTFMTGFELNEATKTFNYNSWSTYAIVFWGQGQATIIKLSGFVACGYEAQPKCLMYNYSLQGVDQDGDKWYICLTQYCY
jgi:hypothetical protein